MSTTQTRPERTAQREVAAPARAGLALRRDDLEAADDRELIGVIRDDGAAAPDRARCVLSERYHPLVIGQVIELHRGRGADLGDVMSVGQHGLRKAIADYDLGHGAHFAAYARAKVRGEVMRWFRGDRYSVNVLRPLDQRFLQVQRPGAPIESRGSDPRGAT